MQRDVFLFHVFDPTSLTGPSGSGKSHFAKELVNFLPGSTIIGMDNYMQREKARLFTCFP